MVRFGSIELITNICLKRLVQHIGNWLAFKALIWCLLFYGTSFTFIKPLHWIRCGLGKMGHVESINTKDWLAYFKNGQWWPDTLTIHVASNWNHTYAPMSIYFCSVILPVCGDYPAVLFGVDQVFKEKQRKPFHLSDLGKVK